MYDPEVEIQTILSTVGTTYQSMPEKTAAYPFITFTVTNNAPNFTIDKLVGSQDIDVKVDFWGMDAEETSTLLAAAEEAMRAANFMLSFSSVVPDPEKISHRTTVFKLIQS